MRKLFLCSWVRVVVSSTVADKQHCMHEVWGVAAISYPSKLSSEEHSWHQEQRLYLNWYASGSFPKTVFSPLSYALLLFDYQGECNYYNICYEFAMPVYKPKGWHVPWILFCCWTIFITSDWLSSNGVKFDFLFSSLSLTLSNLKACSSHFYQLPVLYM